VLYIAALLHCSAGRLVLVAAGTQAERLDVLCSVQDEPSLPARSRASRAAGKQVVRLVDAAVEPEVGFGPALSFSVRLSGPVAGDRPEAQPDV